MSLTLENNVIKKDLQTPLNKAENNQGLFPPLINANKSHESGQLYTTLCQNELMNLDNFTQPGTKTYESYIGKQFYKKKMSAPLNKAENNKG